MTCCRNCEKQIHFDGAVKTNRGKFIPLDLHTTNPHQCEKRYVVNCNKCDVEITFENDFRSKNDKCIPLTYHTGEPHNCKRKPRIGLDEFFWS
jgi:hypothetical protein